jgi:hypothetical protein
LGGEKTLARAQHYRHNLLHGQCISHKNDARLTAVTVNPFNVIQLVVDSKGGVRAEPFKDHFTRRKNYTDRYPTNAADPAYVFVPPQLKYAQLCSSPFHTTFILTKQKSTPHDPASASYSLSFAVGSIALKSLTISSTYLERAAPR